MAVFDKCPELDGEIYRTLLSTHGFCHYFEKPSMQAWKRRLRASSGHYQACRKWARGCLNSVVATMAVDIPVHRLQHTKALSQGDQGQKALKRARSRRGSVGGGKGKQKKKGSKLKKLLPGIIFEPISGAELAATFGTMEATPMFPFKARPKISDLAMAWTPAWHHSCCSQT